jgi:hypothetical protein
MTSVRQINARILEEKRQREAARQTAIDTALAKPLPPRVTQENWDHWHRRGWIVCPGKRDKTCSDPACGVGGKCKRLAELRLVGDGSPLRRKDRPRCGARTRKGALCLVRVEPGKRRFRFHGGFSTGPRTADGKARIAAAQRRRWAEWRARIGAGRTSDLVGGLPTRAESYIGVGAWAPDQPKEKYGDVCRIPIHSREAEIDRGRLGQGSRLSRHLCQRRTPDPAL